MLWRKLLSGASRLLLTWLCAGLFGAALVRLAPGFGVDELELDARLSRESIQAIREARGAEGGIAASYWRYLRNAASGDLGMSSSMGRPIAELLGDRLPLTLRSVAFGLTLGWVAGLSMAASTAIFRRSAYDAAAGSLNGLLLCIPSALLAFFLFAVGAPAAVGIAAMVGPRVFRTAHLLFRDSLDLPHVLTAEAKGLGRVRVFSFHLLPPVAPQLIAWLGTSVTLALGAAIPVEAICDSPGIGQLAWKAALGRDLNLLVCLTLILTAFTLTANFLCDMAIAWRRRSRP